MIVENRAINMINSYPKDHRFTRKLLAKDVGCHDKSLMSLMSDLRASGHVSAYTATQEYTYSRKADAIPHIKRTLKAKRKPIKHKPFTDVMSIFNSMPKPY